jgi:hypothetical protein
MRSSSKILTAFQRVASSAGLIAFFGVAGCVSTKPVAYQDLASASQLKPVTIYDGKDSQFASVSEEGRQNLAEYMQSNSRRSSGKSWKSTTQQDLARLGCT